MAAVIAPAALFLAAGADLEPAVTHVVRDADPVDDPSTCCMQIVAAAPSVPTFMVEQASLSAAMPDTMVAASRYRIVDRSLPVGVAPERGLQVKTILAARAISAEFPQIHNIGGVRPDALRWHPNGLALDVMIPNPSSAEGIALGNQIVQYVLRNAGRFGIQDSIWRGVYYTPGGAKPGGYGHYDHVHVTTFGGGYPTGNEVYLR